MNRREFLLFSLLNLKSGVPLISSLATDAPLVELPEWDGEVTETVHYKISGPAKGFGTLVYERNAYDLERMTVEAHVKNVIPIIGKDVDLVHVSQDLPYHQTVFVNKRKKQGYIHDAADFNPLTFHRDLIHRAVMGYEIPAIISFIYNAAGMYSEFTLRVGECNVKINGERIETMKVEIAPPQPLNIITDGNFTLDLYRARLYIDERGYTDRAELEVGVQYMVKYVNQPIVQRLRFVAEREN